MEISEFVAKDLRREAVAVAREGSRLAACTCARRHRVAQVSWTLRVGMTATVLFVRWIDRCPLSGTMRERSSSHML